MSRALRGLLGLFLLAAVFTGGLTFATVELPRLVDSALQASVPVPGFDSHADAVARLKTDLFLRHYHLRALGWASFAALLLLVGAGFASRRTGLATLGGLAFMLPVFAQFAGVMFFLAGLGFLNVLWLPVLDASLELSRLGLVARAPYDFLRWLLGRLGVHATWHIGVAFVASGLLVFLLGTFSWLSARSRGEAVARGGVYRLSRHPQYLGWILWSYGVLLLLERGRYPRRSWEISASLPWLLSTMVILGVAMLEELRMRRRHPQAYETYRLSAPFLFSVPAPVERLFSLPFRLLFRKDRPERRREVAAVVGLFTVFLLAASAVFYGGGLRALSDRFLLHESRVEAAARLAGEIREERNPRRQRALADRLSLSGDAAVEPLLGLLADPSPGLRALAAQRASRLRSDRVVPALLAALSDPVADVRFQAVRGLTSRCGPGCATHLGPLLADPEVHIRLRAMQLLAELGSTDMLPLATETLSSSLPWQRAAAADALGALASPATVPLLAPRVHDVEPAVRRSVVIALLRSRSPQALPALLTATRDPDREVRVYAAEALKRIPASSPGND